MSINGLTELLFSLIWRSDFCLILLCFLLSSAVWSTRVDSVFLTLYCHFDKEIHLNHEAQQATKKRKEYSHPIHHGDRIIHTSRCS